MQDIKSITELLLKEIAILQKIENPSIEQQLKLRNLIRNLAISDTNKNPNQIFVWCEMVKEEISNLMKCMFCPYGHITECHYPYNCNSEFCNHYPEEDEIWT